MGQRAPDPRRWGGRSTSRNQVLRAIPTWPGQRDVAAGLASRENSTWVGAGSLSYIHAQRVWIHCREKTAQSAGKYRQGGVQAGAVGRQGAAAMAELGFLSELAGHMSVCSRCWSTGRASDRPVDWITWAVGKCGKELRDAFGAMWRHAGGEGIPSIPPRRVAAG